jgi:hypothetical protein
VHEAVAPLEISGFQLGAKTLAVRLGLLRLDRRRNCRQRKDKCRNSENTHAGLPIDNAIPDAICTIGGLNTDGLNGRPIALQFGLV